MINREGRGRGGEAYIFQEDKDALLVLHFPMIYLKFRQFMYFPRVLDFLHYDHFFGDINYLSLSIKVQMDSEFTLVYVHY